MERLDYAALDSLTQDQDDEEGRDEVDQLLDDLDEAQLDEEEREVRHLEWQQERDRLALHKESDEGRQERFFWGALAEQEQ